jgi:hypothetical protein
MLWQDKEKVSEYALVNVAEFVVYKLKRNHFLFNFKFKKPRTRDLNRITQLEQAGTLSN